VPSVGTTLFSKKSILESHREARAGTVCSWKIDKENVKMTVLDTLSLGQKRLAKYIYVAATIWPARSALVKWGHLIERIGLALFGGSCGLYVAALMGRTNVLFGSDWITLLMMLYGAFGSYVGIDLPSRPAKSNPKTTGRMERG
jgi:hypothetical protein